MPRKKRPNQDTPPAARAEVTTPDHSSGPIAQPTWVVVLLSALAVALLAYRAVVLIPGRKFDTDEFEHLQAAWQMGRGMMIYRDFFEHHPPLLHVLLSSVGGLADAPEKIFAARWLMVPFSCGILALVWWSAAKRSGRVAGALACALVSTLLVFQQKAIEIRPDVPALFLLLVAVALQSGSVLSLRRLLAIGASLGCALLFTPKLIFAMPAFALLVMPQGAEQSPLWRRAAALGAGVAIPALIVAGWLNAHDALERAVFLNTTFNAAVPYTFRSLYLGESIVRSLRLNPLFWVAAASAFVAAAIGIRWPRTSERRSDLVIFTAATGLVAGLFLIAVPLQQYLMFVATMLAIVTGVQGAKLITAVQNAGRPLRALLLVAGAAVVLHPLPELLRARHDSNETQLASLRHVWAAVPPDGKVFDVWTGLGLFRTSAYYYGFLGPDIIGALAKLEPTALDTNLIAALITHRPAVVMDPQMASLPPSVTEYIETHYMPESSGLLLLPVRGQD